MRTVSEAVEWVKEHPTRKNVPGARWRLGYGWSWSQLCVALVYDALGATHSYDNANIARKASHIVATSPDVPAGAFAWFDYGKYGHVAFSDGNRLYMASRFAKNLGTALGTLTVSQYAQAAGARYLGYSWDFGGQKFAGVNTSSTGDTHVLTPPTTEESMYRIKAKNWYVGDLTTIEQISHDEAAAFNDAFGDVDFEPISSDNAKLIIAGVKRRRLAALAGQSQAVVDAVSKQLDALASSEQGFTKEDAAKAIADELAKRLAG